MTLSDFLHKTDFYSASERRKAQLIAFYLLKEKGESTFTITDLMNSWGELSVAQPNRTRLLDNLGVSGAFPKASGSKTQMRLHAARVAAIGEEYGALWEVPRVVTRIGKASLIDPERIEELRRLIGCKPDPRRLVRICEEINIAFDNDCWMSAGLLTRTLINHVPPVFEQPNFEAVANNYGGDPKKQRTFRDNAKKLQEVAKNIGDLIAHEQMRPVESLPARTQVDFSNELDVLLQEVARLLRFRNPSHKG